MSILLTATLLLFLLWPAYAILLRYSDRYALNRLLLLLAMVAVCALPFVSLPSPAPVATKSVRGTVSYLEESVKPSVAIVPEQVFHLNEGEGASYEKAPVEATSVNALPLIYGFGLGLMLLVLGVRLLLILALHLRSRLNQDGTYRLLHPGASPGQAFTFARNLYFSEDVPQEADFQHILDHERVHARQGHTLDILLSEFFLCLFWFHPTAWWLRNRMRANLEYLVDKTVVNAGADRRSYQLALVRQSQGTYGLALALPFSEPTLKSRIARMTGLPEYRVVAILAAVALVFWLGVTLLVVNGTVFDDEPPVGREYLEAAAHPGDPYYEYYQNTLPEEFTYIEIYTSRMVTVDEYLQLRAILAKVPGAKLYVYKNAFDEGYSLELRFGNHDPAVANGLNADPSTQNVSILSLGQNGGSNQYLPKSMMWKIDQAGKSGSINVFSFDHGKYFSTNSFLLREVELSKEILVDEVMVYVGKEKIDLVKQPGFNISKNGDSDRASVKINGTEISDFGVEDWPKVTMEARQQPEHQKRLEKLLGIEGPGIRSSSFQQYWQSKGTYRKWYEDFDFPKDQPVIAHYNDRRVSLDFLLDTKFGENAMIQYGVIYDTPEGRYAVQVIDDSPLPAPHGHQKKIVLPGRKGAALSEVDLFFRRLPTPAETKQINQYLTGFTGIDLRVFQDCKNDAGDYTFYLGDESGLETGYGELAVGEVYNGPLRFELKRDNLGVPFVKTHQPGPAPANSPASEVYLLIDGVYVNIHSNSAEPYTSANLDSAPDITSLKCKFTANSETNYIGFWSDFHNGLWMYKYYSVHPEMMEGFEARFKEEGLGDRPLYFYINNEPVTRMEFVNYESGDGAYVRIGALKNDGQGPVILEIVD